MVATTAAAVVVVVRATVVVVGTGVVVVVGTGVVVVVVGSGVTVTVVTRRTVSWPVYSSLLRISGGMLLTALPSTTVEFSITTHSCRCLHE